MEDRWIFETAKKDSARYVVESGADSIESFALFRSTNLML
jgi:hypothetical protein